MAAAIPPSKGDINGAVEWVDGALAKLNAVSLGRNFFDLRDEIRSALGKKVLW